MPAPRVPGAAAPDLVLRAPAKINLGLRILRRRRDGYHEIHTRLATIALSDILGFTRVSAPPGTPPEIECAGPETAGVPTGPTNLVARATALLSEAAGTPLPAIRIRLDKRIPAGAGLGGGSSDAATTLLGVNRLLGLGFPRSRLHRLAARIGMDAPFFLYRGFALATGRGDCVFPLAGPAPALPLVLLLPEFAVPTPEAFRGLGLAPGESRGAQPGAAGTGTIPSPPGASPSRDIATRLARIDLRNDLETSSQLRKMPIPDAVPAMRRALMREGALGAAMTGSGSAVFGVFADVAAAARAAAGLAGATWFRPVATRTMGRTEPMAARLPC